jgi:hypothetical protein
LQALRKVPLKVLTLGNQSPADYGADNMKTSLSLLALALTVTSAFAAPQDVTSPTPTTRPPPDTIIGPIRPTATFAPPDTCSCPGPVLCCIEIVDSTSATGQKILELLGYAIKGPQGFPVGVSCWHACAPGQLCVSFDPRKQR